MLFLAWSVNPTSKMDFRTFPSLPCTGTSPNMARRGGHRDPSSSCWSDGSLLLWSVTLSLPFPAKFLHISIWNCFSSTCKDTKDLVSVECVFLSPTHLWLSHLPFSSQPNCGAVSNAAISVVVSFPPLQRQTFWAHGHLPWTLTGMEDSIFYGHNLSLESQRTYDTESWPSLPHVSWRSSIPVPDISFLPKVVSDFHLHVEISLLVFLLQMSKKDNYIHWTWNEFCFLSE